jgi:hypothetical protein
MCCRSWKCDGFLANGAVAIGEPSDEELVPKAFLPPDDIRAALPQHFIALRANSCTTAGLTMTKARASTGR